MTKEKWGSCGSNHRGSWILIRPLKKSEVKKQHRKVEPSDDGGLANSKSTHRKIGAVSILRSKWVTGNKTPFYSAIKNLVTGLGF